MRTEDLPKAMKILREEYRRFKTPYVTEVAAARRKDPFKVLVSCIISLRTKDDTTREASGRLFALAATPEAILSLKPEAVEKAIYPAGFYRNKARTIIEISRELVEKHASMVPDTIDGLLTLKGVGRKTANLVVTFAYNKPGICVDIHVHRITNRWGFVSAPTPDKTEMELRKKLPPRYWIEINDLLVAYGQNLCRPVSPFCGRCRLISWCDGVGVAKRR